MSLVADSGLDKLVLVWSGMQLIYLDLYFTRVLTKRKNSAEKRRKDGMYKTKEYEDPAVQVIGRIDAEVSSPLRVSFHALPLETDRS